METYKCKFVAKNPTRRKWQEVIARSPAVAARKLAEMKPRNAHEGAHISVWGHGKFVVERPVAIRKANGSR